MSRLPEERLERLQARRRAENLTMSARRVEATRRASAESAEGRAVVSDVTPRHSPPEEATGDEEVAADQATTEAEDDTGRGRTEEVHRGPAGTEEEAVTEDPAVTEAGR